MKLDLHVHTDISDGFLSIEQTLLAAKRKGLDGIAITDHDTTDGCMQAIALGAKLGLKVIPGVEISAIDNKTGVKVHILGYFTHLPAANVEKLCKPLRVARQQNSLKKMHILVEHGYQLDSEQIIAKRIGRPIYKQHIMQELIRVGYTDRIYSDLYKKLFKNNGICAEEIEYLDATQAIAAIKADGGIAVLAHPGHDNNYFLLEELIAAGLDGIELFHEKHNLTDLKKIMRLAKQYNLIMSGGSDYHGEVENEFFGKLFCPRTTREYFINNNNNIEVFLHELAVKAGEHLVELTSKKNTCVHYKDSKWNNLVTDIDIALEEFLVSSIQEYFADSSFITEEKTVSNSCDGKYTWIIDPLDGTTNFVSCKKDYAVSVAVYKHQKPFAGLVYDVVSQDIYVAIAGQGAWLNGQRMAVTNKVKKLKDAVLDFSINTVVELHERGKNLLRMSSLIRGHRAYGCASLSICKIALGELDSYISSKLCVWDYAAAEIFLKELGGEVVLCKDEEQSEKCSLFIAANSTELIKEILIVTAK